MAAASFPARSTQMAATVSLPARGEADANFSALLPRLREMPGGPLFLSPRGEWREDEGS